MSSSGGDDAMDIDEPAAAATGAPATAKMEEDVEEEEEEEDVSALIEALDKARAATPNERIPLLLKLLQDDTTTTTTGPKAIQLQESAVYDLTRAYCSTKQYDSVVEFLTTSAAGKAFLGRITKAKTAKVVRQVLDICCQSEAPYTVQESVARSILSWTQQEKRSFLRQRVQAKLASILFGQAHYVEALELCDGLLYELKKLDDKQLLVETHLLESQIHFALRNVPKAKAALTASRTAANAIYVSPHMQAEIDSMSGTIHTEEGDYNTAHSYFLEAFEQLDQMNTSVAAAETEARTALKYMMLCKILDSLRVALKLSASANAMEATTKTTDETSKNQAQVELSGMLTGKQGVKYAGRDIEAMSAIASASMNRNLKQFEKVLQDYPKELQDDLLIKHHLHILQEQLLESNLIRIIEPYSCVELEHVATLIDMPVATVEKKLSQMILDGKFQGILDQGKGQLVVYEQSQLDKAMEKGLQVIANMDAVVSSLFERSKALRTMMI